MAPFMSDAILGTTSHLLQMALKQIKVNFSDDDDGVWEMDSLLKKPQESVYFSTL